MELSDYIGYIKEKHKGQKRKQGTPYYTHPLAVSNILKEKGFSIDYQIAGLFHDLLEDTDTSYEEIIKISNPKIAEAVRLVTKEKGYVMDEYINRIRNNDMARMVKLADRIHNLSETHLTSKKFQERYIKETEDWYIDLAKGTVFEDELNKKLNSLIVTNKINFLQYGDVLEEVEDGRSIATLYKVIREGKCYFLKIFNSNYSEDKILRIIESINIYKKLEINVADIIDYGYFDNMSNYYIIYTYLEGENIKYISNNYKIDYEEIRKLGEKVGKNILKLKNYKYNVKAKFETDDINSLKKETINNFNKFLNNKQCKSIINKFYTDYELNDMINTLENTSRYFDNLKPRLIHGDIKRANVMKDKSHKLWLVDIEDMKYSYDLLNFRYTLSWELSDVNGTYFTKGFFDGLYNNKRPENFNEQVMFVLILNLMSVCYKYSKDNLLDKIEWYINRYKGLDISIKDKIKNNDNII